MKIESIRNTNFKEVNYQRMLTLTQTNLQPIITQEAHAATLTSRISGDSFTVNNTLQLPVQVIFDGNILNLGHIQFISSQTISYRA